MSIIRKVINSLQSNHFVVKTRAEIIESYKQAGSVPWSVGYNEHKWDTINEGISKKEIVKQFAGEKLIEEYGKGLDERVIEYPWLMSHIIPGKGTFLDAGSTFNFQLILDHPIMQDKDIYIYTYYPEVNNFASKRVSHVYGDLRELPFKDGYFDQVVCHSTLEHIDMDNSMYGYELVRSNATKGKSYEYLKVIKELERVVKPGGKVLLTFPYGKFENHGFFQQFDFEMVQQMEQLFTLSCTCRKAFALYKVDGWRFASQSDCEESFSFNPHTGQGKGDDNAAHSRAICFMEIKKNNG
ncbi:MAG: class I SAM-dependent methyltransferase [Chitinophagaceae bacterium]|nr:class I SAM-dependent methyltransferase [Chitinophagaceae bacterium]